MDPFPSIKCDRMLALLRRKPLSYRQKPGKKRKGSHRHLVSDAGYPDIAFWCHKGTTLPGSVVREILVHQVGLSEKEARNLI